ncbi:Fe-S cluster assembly protein SufD [Paenibacillus whitsoniae]|uniref:Fe-S cluster assembly protein SufD n=1 Tax=Paenibacillus whitsoniae TaxID=2496558 RepID=A0A430JE89_9BACL|nr:Fe-S cluster assembly protein SufD [Paenibacillus whitsoniae]RTE09315.1 Fe-S cluster assembly protein SufD [Paenibacillus whitsoniae]
MSNQTTLSIDSNSVLELSRSKQEPEWMTTLRSEGLSLANSLDLPTLEKTRIDRWSISSYGSYKAQSPVASVDALPAVSQGLAGGENVIVQRNSGIVFTQVSEALKAQGVIFTDLETAVREHADLVKPYFMKAVEANENQVTATHAALWNGGVFIYVPKNVVIEAPLQALFIADDAEATFAPHILIVAEQFSSVSFVENFVSALGGAPLVQNGVVEVFTKPGARVSYSSVHSMEESVTDLTYRRAILEDDSAIAWVVGELNYGNSMSDTTSILRGKGSDSDAKVICVGTQEQKLNLTTRAVHWGKASTSDMITRAVMRDGATAIINGITKIEKGATGCNGQQTEKVLMLSPKARGDANPILLIDEDDVKAGHAASVGQVNAEQVHYLMSRGITKEEAQRLIIYGFLAPVVSEIPVKSVEDQLQSLVERKLGQ